MRENTEVFVCEINVCYAPLSQTEGAGFGLQLAVLLQLEVISACIAGVVSGTEACKRSEKACSDIYGRRPETLSLGQGAKPAFVFEILLATAGVWCKAN